MAHTLYSIYFKNINCYKDEADDDVINVNEIAPAVDLNGFFKQTNKESSKTMKNNKAPGHDNVLNEYTKTTLDIFLPVYTLVFNLIASSLLKW